MLQSIPQTLAKAGGLRLHRPTARSETGNLHGDDADPVRRKDRLEKGRSPGHLPACRNQAGRNRGVLLPGIISMKGDRAMESRVTDKMASTSATIIKLIRDQEVSVGEAFRILERAKDLLMQEVMESEF